ncbi:hypothetical protein IRB23M11_23190 [Alkalibacterium sp. m-11]|uniref:YjcQ protein n=1 Tax=Alkalibacterium indicireducens TaxID=398758 RepID=A0ABN1AM61_9LACT
MKQYSERIYIAVLKIVKNDLDFDILLSESFSYADIGLIIKYLKRNGLVSDLSGYLEVTELGEKYIKDTAKKLRLGNIEKFIIPQLKDVIEKNSKFDVYLP